MAARLKPRSRLGQRVLVLGAGISGLAAARTLADGGNDVVVLEARDRIGGRIDTSSQWMDTPVDLGASWIHGTTGNPISAIVSEIGAQTVVTDVNLAEIYGPGGAPLNAQQEARLDQLGTQTTQAILDGQDAVVDRSVADTVNSALDVDQLPLTDRQYVDYHLNAFQQCFAGSVNDLSTYWFDSAMSYPGDEVIFRDGYRVITDHLAAGLTIQLSTVVTHVEATPSGVTVTTDQGQLTGDRVVVTLPLGVLKQGSVQFTPALPMDKQNAIDALDMGTFNKCYLRFPQSFWPQNLDWLAQVPQEFGRWSDWLNIDRALGQPILMGFNSGDFGRDLEAWSNQDIVASGMERLRSIFGQAIPEPTDFQITRWSSDPHTRGSYSFYPVDSSPAMRAALETDIDDRIFFAGEATSRDHPSTVHGAYQSGVDAAERIQGTSLIFADGFESGNTSAW